jgi:hypothetical protein
MVTTGIIRFPHFGQRVVRSMRDPPDFSPVTGNWNFCSFSSSERVSVPDRLFLVVRLSAPDRVRQPGSIFSQNVNTPKLLLNLLDAPGAEGMSDNILAACNGPPAVFTRYDRNRNGRCAVFKRPQLFRKDPTQISVRNLSFSHAPPPQCATQGHHCGRLSGFGSAQLSPNGEALISRAFANHHPAVALA